MPGETIERAAIRPTVADIEAAADLYKRLMKAERILNNAGWPFGTRASGKPK